MVSDFSISLVLLCLMSSPAAPAGTAGGAEPTSENTAAQEMAAQDAIIAARNAKDRGRRKSVAVALAHADDEYDSDEEDLDEDVDGRIAASIGKGAPVSAGDSAGETKGEDAPAADLVAAMDGLDVEGGDDESGDDSYGEQAEPKLSTDPALRAKLEELSRLAVAGDKDAFARAFVPLDLTEEELVGYVTMPAAAGSAPCCLPAISLCMLLSKLVPALAGSRSSWWH